MAGLIHLHFRDGHSLHRSMLPLTNAASAPRPSSWPQTSGATISFQLWPRDTLPHPPTRRGLTLRSPVGVADRQKKCPSHDDTAWKSPQTKRTLRSVTRRLGHCWRTHFCLLSSQNNSIPGLTPHLVYQWFIAIQQGLDKSLKTQLPFAPLGSSHSSSKKG